MIDKSYIEIIEEYSLTQLYDARKRIDKDEFPERYEMLNNRIESLEKTIPLVNDQVIYARNRENQKNVVKKQIKKLSRVFKTLCQSPITD